MKFILAVFASAIGALSIGAAILGGDEPTSGDLATLGKARLDAAKKAYVSSHNKGGAGEIVQIAPEASYQLSVRWLNAELEMASKKDERIAAYGSHLERTKAWGKALKMIAGAESPAFDVVNSFQREAEYWLAKERASKK